jgi:hypothetical protein
LSHHRRNVTLPGKQSRHEEVDLMKTPRALSLWLVALPLACIDPVRGGDPLDTWHWRNPRPTAQPLFDVTWGNNEFVAVGAHGTVLTSPDGEHWLNQASGVTEDLRDVVWGDGQYVAVGDYGVILTSPDARHWTEQFTRVFIDLNAVAYGGGQFVAVGANTTVLSSADGVRWLECARGQDMLYDVAFGNGRFVAVGGDVILDQRWAGGWVPTTPPGDPLLLVSTDGLNWRRGEAGGYGTLTAIAYGRGRFVTALYRFPWNSTVGAVLTSTDGTRWEDSSWMDLNLQEPVRCMAFEERLGFAAFFGRDTMAPNVYVASDDGYHWYFQPNVSEMVAEGVAIRASTIVVAGRDLSPFARLAARRPDGIWIDNVDSRLPGLQRVGFVGGKFMGFHMQWDDSRGWLPGGLVSSPDGITWASAHGTSDASFADVAFANGLYVSVGGHGWVGTSADAVNWSAQPAPAADNLSGIAYGANQFVAVGATGAVWTATDGTNWTRHAVADESDFAWVCYGNGLFATLDRRDGTVLTSTNGVDWIHQPSSPAGKLIRLRFGGGYFAAVSEVNKLLLSTNASSWTPVDCPIVSTYQLDFAVGPNLFVAAGGAWYSSWGYSRLYSSIWTSTDGVHWREHDTGSDFPFQSVCFGQDTLVAAGASTVLVQSDPLAPKAPTLVEPPASEAYEPGRFITLSALASGTSPIDYLWFQDGDLVPGANESLLPRGQLQTGEVHEYRVVASNALGIATSAPVRVVCGQVPVVEVGAAVAPVLTVGGTPGLRYEVHYQDVLAEPPAWSLLTNLLLSAPTVQFADPDGAAVKNRFYRAQLVP